MLSIKKKCRLAIYLSACAILVTVFSSVLGCKVFAANFDRAVAETSNEISKAEQQGFELLNTDRQLHGLPPLRLNLQLAKLAKRYAQDMITRHYFAHKNPEGQSPIDRMNQAGVKYGYAGENLAINSSVVNAEGAFMRSPGHKANILNIHYTEVGVGVKYGNNGAVYVVQEFISPNY